MNSDITIVYYTANIINDDTSLRIRKHLLDQSQGLRIISVSQQPLDFGDNICIGEMGQSVYNLFKQTLIGAKEVKTKFMVCAEDDYLYGPSRFDFVPPRDDTFYYDINRWGCNRDGRFFWRERTIFGMCMAPTKCMVDTLEERLEKIKPEDHRVKYFSEPGKYEGHWGGTPVKMQRISLDIPTITFNHHHSMGKRRMIRGTDTIQYDLPYWGNGKKLWEEYML